MKLPFPIIAGVLFASLTVAADQVTTQNGSILVGKAQIAQNGQVQIAGQTLPPEQVQRIIFESNALKPGLSGVTFNLYQGNWNALPDFTQLSIDKSGTMSTNRLDLSPLELDGANRIFRLNHGDTMDRWSAPPIEGRPFAISATVVAQGDGVLVAQGGNQGGNQNGMALYLQNGHLNFVTRIKNENTIARDELPFPLHEPVKVLAEFRRDMQLVLTVDDREAARVEAPGMLPARPPEGLSVGFDQRRSGLGLYRNDHHFQGELRNLQLRVMGMGLVYRGKLNVVQDGDYTFNISADAATELKINTRPVTSGKAMRLTAGSHSFQMTYAQLATPSQSGSRENLTVDWSGPGLNRQPLTALPDPQAPSWHPADTAIPSAGILTLDGSFLAETVNHVDRTHIQFGETKLERQTVSTLFLRSLSIFETRELVDKPAGVLRIDGTFTEGKLLRVDKETVTLSNILFGLKTLKRGIDAVAVVVNPSTSIDPKVSILLHDGSILFAPQYSVKDGQLHLRDHPLQDAPIPLQSIAEVVHGHAPNHVERAEARWEKHSEMGQQFLGDRTRKAMDIIKKFREAQFRLAAADKQFIKAKRALPAAEKSELAAKVKRDDALPSLTAPTALVKTHTDAHNQTLQVLTTAENKAAADCTRTGQSYNIWWQTVQFKRRPALQALAEAQLAWLQAKPDQRPALEQKRAQAAQDLARINEEIKRHRTELDTHLQTGLNSDQAVTAAQARQGATLQKLSAAAQALAKVQDAFNLLDQDWMEKKAQADQLRGEVNRSKRDSDMAKGQIGILEPSLQSTFRP